LKCSIHGSELAKLSSAEAASFGLDALQRRKLSRSHQPAPEITSVMHQPIDRRTALLRLAALTGAPLFLGTHAIGEEVIKEIHMLEPGEFTWHPERSPQGAVAIVVSIPEQLVHVYRNGIRIAVSTCSTGREGHATPTGVFTVLQKDKDHRSSTYNNAPMPNMNRLTWDGIALHAGNLPGYPASHGCVRLPLAFSAKLWTVTQPGHARNHRRQPLGPLGADPSRHGARRRRRRRAGGRCSGPRGQAPPLRLG
jgi:hypothetical protein